MKTPSMKIPIVYEKRVKTVGDVVTELLKLDQKSKVENEWPDEDEAARFSTWRDEDTGKVSIKLGL